VQNQNHTILLLQFIACLVVSIAWAVGATLMREKRSPMVHWSICSVLLGMGAWLTCQRGVIENFWAYGVCDLVLMLGIVGMHRGVRKFVSDESQSKADVQNGSLLAACMAFLLYAKFALNDDALEVEAFGLFAGYFLLSTGMQAMRNMRSQFGMPASLATVFPLHMAGLLFIVRCIIGLIFPDDHLEDFHLHSDFNVMFLFAVFTMHLMLNISLGGLVVSKLISEIRHLSISDALTGLSNRRFLEETLELEMSRFRRWNRPFSVLMLDIDHFKTVNDTHGHDVGDEVLKCVAKVIKDSARNNDITGRWGGEEFFLILPETGQEGGEIFSERLRAEIEKSKVPHTNGPIKVTASMGLATAASHHLMWRELVKEADSAMYRAKAAGRNRVEKAPLVGKGNVVPLRNKAL
jgi:diguanylate cyclase (GGDEF)-like protein